MFFVTITLQIIRHTDDVQDPTKEKKKKRDL